MTALVAGITFPAIGAIEIPDDHRYFTWTGEREEDPAYVVRKQRGTIEPWPDYGRLGPPARVFHPVNSWTSARPEESGN